MFIQFNNNIYNTQTIKKVLCKHFITSGTITVIFDNNSLEIVHGAEATNLIMTLCPSVLEGKRASYVKNKWVLHNLVGHPLMQVFSWFGMRKLSIWVHEATIPTPNLPINRQ